MPAPHAETETGSNYRTMRRLPRVDRCAVTANTVVPSGGSALFSHLAAISVRRHGEIARRWAQRITPAKRAGVTLVTGVRLRLPPTRGLPCDVGGGRAVP